MRNTRIQVSYRQHDGASRSKCRGFYVQLSAHPSAKRGKWQYKCHPQRVSERFVKKQTSFCRQKKKKEVAKEG